MFSGILSKLTRASAIVAAIVVFVDASGCGSDPYAATPVHGKITFEDGTVVPAGRITIQFIAQVEAADKKTVPRPAMAEVDVSDGTFSEVTTHRFGDGLIPGKHTVEAFTYDGNGNQVPLAIHPAEIEVSKDSNVFEFQVPR